jgi:hypothetical protein
VVLDRRSLSHGAYGDAMTSYLVTITDGDAGRAVRLLRAGRWPVDAREPHGTDLAAGDRALFYLAAPTRVFLGCATLSSGVDDGPKGVSQHADDALSGAGLVDSNLVDSNLVDVSLVDVSLVDVEEWDPPVPMHAVLARIDRSAGARADFETTLVRITEVEYETAVAVAAEWAAG